jgi:hypothetical protein
MQTVVCQELPSVVQSSVISAAQAAQRANGESERWYAGARLLTKCSLAIGATYLCFFYFHSSFSDRAGALLYLRIHGSAPT